MNSNAIACRKYYERNRDNPEFRLRNAFQTRRQYYKKTIYEILENVPSLENMVRKDTVIEVKVKAFTKRIEEQNVKRYKR